MKILLTGVTGYIGARLLPVLIEAGHDVYAVIRDRSRFQPPLAEHPRLHLVEADFLDREQTLHMPGQMDAAFYLVHSITQKKADFSAKERICAENFVQYAESSHLGQIIYLSGIVNDETLSEHLKSRLQVEQCLTESKVPTTVLRCGIVIGSGSASFEIIRDLVEKLPIMVAPRWLDTRCQPIAVRDVLRWCMSVLNRRETRVYDIGGPSILTYRDMLLGYAEVRGLKRRIFTLPVLTPRLSSYWLFFITSTNYPLAKNLVDSMKNEVICRSQTNLPISPESCIDYKEALHLALDKVENDNVLSSWKDAVTAGRLTGNFLNYVHVPERGVLTDVCKVPLEDGPDAARRRIRRIGGKTGWYYMDWAWHLRGVIDKLVGGVGLRRGRRSMNAIRIGDPIDFWRVLVTDEQTNRLLLYAEMRLPGEAWLEFKLGQENGSWFLTQTATFRPRGIFGRLYWYSLVPVHFFIFKGTARAIAGAAQPKNPKNRKTEPDRSTA